MDPEQATPQTRRRMFGRFAPLVAVSILGFALVTAVRTADPGPRVGSRARLIDLIEREDVRSRQLRAEFASLQAELEGLEDAAARRERTLATLRARLARLGPVAGLAPVSGPGLRVELRDSPLRRAPSGDVNDLVVHEQDIQSVVNALWAGGAEAMAVNGERITAFSAVRCVGNTLLLHGSVYSPPYRIDAIGDPGRLEDALLRDGLVERFRILAEEFKLGFSVGRADDIRLGAFTGRGAGTS